MVPIDGSVWIALEWIDTDFQFWKQNTLGIFLYIDILYLFIQASQLSNRQSKNCSMESIFLTQERRIHRDLSERNGLILKWDYRGKQNRRANQRIGRKKNSDQNVCRNQAVAWRQSKSLSLGFLFFFFFCS